MEILTAPVSELPALSPDTLVCRAAAASLKLPQLAHEAIHRFQEGIYLRETTLPANSWCVGYRHKFPCHNFVLTGRAKVYANGVVHEITAPYFFRSEAGVAKILIVFEEMRWITVHANPDNEMDPVKLHDRFFMKYESPGYGETAKGTIIL